MSDQISLFSLVKSGVPKGWYPSILAARLLILPVREVWRGACVAWEVPGKALPAADVEMKNFPHVSSLQSQTQARSSPSAE